MDLLFTSSDAPAPEPVEPAPAPVARWLLAGDTPDGRLLRAHPAFRSFEVVAPGAWFAGGARDPGLVVVALDGIDGPALAHLLVECGAEEGWVVAAWRGDEDVRVLSASSRYGADELLPSVLGHDGAPYLLDLRRVLKDVSVARHDLNNPLTSALAETQLLLMDEPGGEVGESLETIQRQLRRLRDLIRLLSPIRLRG